MSYLTIKTRKLSSRLHAFRNKTKQKIKIQGSLKHYDSYYLDTLLAPPHTWEKHCPQFIKKTRN
jgi:hypothetical protein